MIIKPRVRGFICLTAHPTGCAELVDRQIATVETAGPIHGGPQNVLVVGASGGYGLSSRIVSAFGMGARTIGLSYEREPAEDKSASAGWYNNAAFDRAAAARGLYSTSVNADAFADTTKAQIGDLIEADLGQIDLLVYSLASPVRTDPDTGVTHRSTIKAVGEPARVKSLNVEKGVVSEVEVAAATEEEMAGTVKVMGGEDWERWIAYLGDRGLLSPGFRTVSYTYIGSEITWPIYWEGTLGKAKEDLDRAAAGLRERLAPIGGDAHVAVLKAVVTQASSAIPAVPLYLSILLDVMKERGVHEDCLAQIHRLFRTAFVSEPSVLRDDRNRFRVDDWELAHDVQAEVNERWRVVTTETLDDLADLDGYRTDFLRIFGFDVDGVDYEADVSPF